MNPNSLIDLRAQIHSKCHYILWILSSNCKVILKIGLFCNSPQSLIIIKAHNSTVLYCQAVPDIWTEALRFKDFSTEGFSEGFQRSDGLLKDPTVAELKYYTIHFH